jgi:hypothetical protein
MCAASSPGTAAAPGRKVSQIRGRHFISRCPAHSKEVEMENVKRFPLFEDYPKVIESKSSTP